MNIHVLPTALQDIVEAASFYDSLEPGQGFAVHIFLDAQIEKLSETAGQHRRIGRYYRVFTRGKFDNFSIYYLLELGHVYVDAVLDQRRDPDHNRRLLSERH